ncbi:MAG: hypothetical protein AMXMBFR82_28810 [Candidatus Hydrogenedentota bacterium]
MTTRLYSFVPALLILACFPAFAEEEPAPDLADLPWSLRDHYTITTADQQMYITYGGDNGEWSLDIKGIGTVLTKVAATITLADGSVIDLRDLGVGDTTRYKETAELGPGMKYTVKMSAPNGLGIVHSLTYHETHPFYVVRMELTNNGSEPLEVARISPVVIGPGGFGNLSLETTESPRRFDVIGASPVYTKVGDPLFSLFHDPVKNVTLAVGGLPVGRAKTGVHLEKFEGRYQGHITTTFDPAVTLAPGASLASDPVWIAFTLPKPADVDMFYAWAHANMPDAKSEGVPECWVTVPDGESLPELIQAVNFWKGADVAHALVPVTWEGRPGSLEGAQPDYPKDMANAAAQLRQAGATPGITLDPLAVVDGKDEFTAVSADGQRWLNPANEQGKQFGVERLRAVARWGFGFYVVEPSLIPDEVLKHFNLTRTQANDLAYDMMVEVAAGAPVLGASEATLGASIDEWLLAAAATSRMEEYSVVVGPVRFDANAAGDLPDDAVTAMAFFGGPIELVGNPSSGLLKQIGKVFPKPYIWPRAIDSGSPAPKLWQVHVQQSQGAGERLAIVSFPGARAHTPADLVSPSGEGLQTMESSAAEFLDALGR